MSVFKNLEVILRSSKIGPSSIKDWFQSILPTSSIYGQFIPYLLEYVEYEYILQRRIMSFRKFSRQYLLEFIYSERHRFKKKHINSLCQNLKVDNDQDQTSSILIKRLIGRLEQDLYPQYNFFQKKPKSKRYDIHPEFSSTIVPPPPPPPPKKIIGKKRKRETDPESEGDQRPLKKQKVDHHRNNIITLNKKKVQSQAKKYKKVPSSSGKKIETLLKLMMSKGQTEEENECLLIQHLKLHRVQHEYLLIRIVGKFLRRRSLGGKETMIFFIRQILPKKFIIGGKKSVTREMIKLCQEICKLYSSEFIKFILVPIFQLSCETFTSAHFNFVNQVKKFLHPRSQMIPLLLNDFFSHQNEQKIWMGEKKSNKKMLEQKRNWMMKFVRSLFLMKIQSLNEQNNKQLVSSILLRLESLGHHFTRNVLFGLLLKSIYSNYPGIVEENKEFFKDIVQTHQSFVRKEMKI